LLVNGLFLAGVPALPRLFDRAGPSPVSPEHPDLSRTPRAPCTKSACVAWPLVGHGLSDASRAVHKIGLCGMAARRPWPFGRLARCAQNRAGGWKPRAGGRGRTDRALCTLGYGLWHGPPDRGWIAQTRPDRVAFAPKTWTKPNGPVTPKLAARAQRRI